MRKKEELAGELGSCRCLTRELQGVCAHVATHTSTHTNGQGKAVQECTQAHTHTCVHRHTCLSSLTHTQIQLRLPAD